MKPRRLKPEQRNERKQGPDTGTKQPLTSLQVRAPWTSSSSSQGPARRREEPASGSHDASAETLFSVSLIPAIPFISSLLSVSLRRSL